MPFFTYNRDVPDGPNNPSNDQPDMQVNTNSTDDILNQDHFSFNLNEGGLHRKMRVVANAGTPSGLLSNTGTLFVQPASGARGPDLFYIPRNGTDVYQLTTTNTTNISQFAVNNPYGTPPPGFTQRGGWTFLAGGLIMQYGFYGQTGATGTSGTIQFPVAFLSPPFYVGPILYRNSGNQTWAINSAIPPTTTAFTFLTSSGGSDGFYWTAIGTGA